MNNTNFPSYIKERKSELIAVCSKRSTADNMRKMLENGRISNSLNSLKGRVIEKDNKFCLYAYRDGKVLLNKIF